MSYQLPPSQPTYPPQFQQPPMQPMPTPKPRRRLPWLWIIASLFVGFLIGFVAHVPPATTTTAPQQTTTTASSQPTPIPTLPTAPPVTPIPTSPPNPHGALGVTQQSDVWAITVNSVKPTAGGQFDDAPKAGDAYMLINFTAKNTGSTNASMSPAYFTLRDSQGNTFDLAYITVPNDPRGDVVAGQQLRGDLSYELPKTLHAVILQFDAPKDFDGNQIVQWQLSV